MTLSAEAPAGDTAGGINPQDIIDHAPMSRAQIVAVTLAAFLNGLDGLDVLAISFAAPLIAKDWAITMIALGGVLSMEVVGMAAGSAILGSLTDRVGRRSVMLICLCLMTAGTLSSAVAATVVQLSACRILTGMGIGGMVVALNTAVSELSNLRRRNLCVSLVVVGYSLGAVFGGIIITALLRDGDWRVVFWVCGALTAGFIPLVWWLMPESPTFLARRGTARALHRMTVSLAKMGLPSPSPDIIARPPDVSESTAVFYRQRPLVRLTALLAVCYFGQMFTFYFLMKWGAKLVVDMGYSLTEAGSILVIMNAGGVVAGVIFGALTLRFSLKYLTLAAMLLNFLAVCWFGFGSGSFGVLAFIALCTGSLGSACIVGIFAVLASVFPSEHRGTGTGLVIGVGRSGAILSPIAAGAMLEAHFVLWQIAACLGAGSLLAAAMLMAVRMPGRRAA